MTSEPLGIDASPLRTPAAAGRHRGLDVDGFAGHERSSSIIGTQVLSSDAALTHCLSLAPAGWRRLGRRHPFLYDQAHPPPEVAQGCGHRTQGRVVPFALA
jgi:hypothetical protein